MTASVFLAMQLAVAAADGPLVAADLSPPIPVLVAGKPLDVEHEGQAAPFVADFDGDGKKDLLVGEAYKGRLRIYRNVGTNREPRFENYTIFQDGAPGGCIWANCIGFGPDWIDFDGDGIPDILSGSGRQQVIVFRGRPGHTFAAGEPIKDKTGEPLRIDYGLAVFAVDWDNDGKLDLLLGLCGPNGNGVYLLRNEGTKTRPQFSHHKPLLADGKPIQIPGRPPHRQSGPVAADWDGDGKLDLIVGCGDGSVVWYRNVGAREKPAFHKPEVLVAAPNGQPATRDHGMSVKICVTDWNEDGRLDLLVGDAGEQFAKHLNDDERKLRDAARTQQAEAFRSWASVFREYRTLRGQPAPQSDTDRPAHEKRLKSKLDELVRLGALREKSHEDETALAEGAQTHGRVWVYLRK
jgi:FG-GAP-like repeat